MRIVSYSTWHHCVSCRQETVRERFPIRRYAIVFLTGRKLFAKGFLFGIATLCFIATGNFFAGRFLDSARNDMGGMATLCFLPTGNFLRRVSWSTLRHCVSYRQETVCGGFPGRLGTIVFLAGRKLFANGFLFGLTPLCFNATGNYLRIVSYSTWHYCVSYRQETICEWFPIRHSNTVFHRDKKLFAHGFLFDMALLCILPTGNYSPGDFSTPLPTLEMTGGMAAMGFSTTVSRQRIADKADHKKAGPHGSAFCYSLFFRCLIPLSAMSWRYCTPCQWILETPL